MSFSKPGIASSGEPQRNWYAVEKTEPLKGQNQDTDPSSTLSNEALLIAAFCVRVKRMLSSLISNRPLKQIVRIAQSCDLSVYLKQFRDNLFRLSQEDLSFDPTFMHDLAESWHSLIEASNLIELLDRDQRPETDELKKLLKTIAEHPPKNDQSFGLYMTKFIGEKWLPFPFIELLHELHASFQTHPQSNPLISWIQDLDHLITIFS